MVDENGMGGHTTIQPEQYHPIAWLCYTWAMEALMSCWGFVDHSSGVTGSENTNRLIAGGLDIVTKLMCCKVGVVNND